MQWTWFKSWKRDLAVLGGVVVVCFLVWFGAPYMWDSYNTSRELPKSVPVTLSSQEREEAEQTVRELHKKMSENSEKKETLMITLGNTYEQLGLLRKAAQTYRTIVRFQPENSESIGALARVYELAGRHERAKLYYEQGYELQPQKKEFYEQYAHFLIITQQDSAQARGVYLKGLLITKNDPELMKIFISFLEQYGYGEEAKLYKEYLKNVTRNK